MRKRIKRTVLEVFSHTGLFRAFAGSRWRHNRLVILCYHGISLEDEHEWDPTLFMSPTDFEQRLELLKRAGYHVLPLAEAIERLYKRDLPPRSVAITFDDGGYEFYARAWPLLRSYGYPATVYLTTYYCDDNRPVFDPTASYLLWKARGRMLDADAVGLPAPLDLRTDAARRASWQNVLRHASAHELTADEKDALLRRIASQAGVDYGDMKRRRLLHIMNPREVRELSAAGLDVQLHTHRHRTPIDRTLFLREIRDNQARVRALTGRDPEHFCYPRGFHRPEFLPWLAECGVRYAVTCAPKPATDHSHPLLLPRFTDHANLSGIEFASGVCGFGLLLPNEG